MAATSLTPRQREALAWLETVGKASEKLVRRNGFAVRTFDALADGGHVERFFLPRVFGGDVKVYRELRARKAS